MMECDRTKHRSSIKGKGNEDNFDLLYDCYIHVIAFGMKRVWEDLSPFITWKI